MIREILPGIETWSVSWPGVFTLESFKLTSDEGAVLIDPMDYNVDVSNVIGIIVTRFGHMRSALVFAAESGAPIYLPDFDAERADDLDVQTFSHGNVLPCGLQAIETRDDRAWELSLLSPLDGGTLIVGDSLGTMGKWVPNGEAIGAHPYLKRPAETLKHLLDIEFKNLLPGHGPAYLGYAKERLAELIEKDAAGD